MSRKRYISTDISTDPKLAELSAHGFLPLLLYTWSIPHMDDWGRITGDARQFKLLVCPGLDVVVREVEEALKQVAAAGLWERYEVDGKWFIAAPKHSWFKHQSYINKAKRDDDSGSTFPSPDKRRRTPRNSEERQETPQISEEQQGEPQNAVSFSSSFSVSPSPSKHYSSTSTGELNPFKLFESEGFGTLSGTLAEKIGDMIDEYGERWVCEAMKEAAYYSKRSLPYVKKVLDSYRASGVDEPWTIDRKQQQQKQSPNVAAFPQRTRSGKPHIPIVEQHDGQQMTEEELAEALRLARELEEGA